MASGSDRSASDNRFLEKAYGENFPWFLRYVQRNSGSREEALDVFQDSLLAAWLNANRGRFTGDAQSFNAYLRKICKYKWLNTLKRAKRLTLTLDQATALTAEEDESLADSARLRRSLSQLGEKCRNILTAFYFEGKTISEIASEWGDQAGSIKTIKYRCMMRLRKFYLELDRDDD